MSNTTKVYDVDYRALSANRKLDLAKNIAKFTMLKRTDSGVVLVTDNCKVYGCNLVELAGLFTRYVSRFDETARFPFIV